MIDDTAEALYDYPILKQKLDKIKKLLKKITEMNAGDYNFYARTEIRHAYEDLNSQEKRNES